MFGDEKKITWYKLPYNLGGTSYWVRILIYWIKLVRLVIIVTSKCPDTQTLIIVV